MIVIIDFELSPLGLYFERVVFKLWHYFEGHRAFLR